MIRYLGVLLGLALLALLVPLLISDKGRRSLVLALRSLWLHKLRSFLSVLGIIIGTGAVIALVAFGEGTMHDALEDIKRQGATNIMIRSVRASEESSTAQRQRVAIYGLTWADYRRFMTIPTVVRTVPMRIFPQVIRHLDRQDKDGRVVGTTGDYAEVNKVRLAAGRFFTAADDRRMLNVAVLGAGVADKLFPFEDPIGKTVRLDKYFYEIIGVLRDRMPTSAVGGSSQTAENFNSDVYIPLQTCKVRYGERVVSRQSGSWNAEQVELSQVTLTITDMESVRPAGEVVKDLLQRYHGAKSDWAITIPLDRLEAAERERDRFTGLLAIVASISLVVGGIGIMNIMLATVTERTREIGIRRALGAKRKDITLQFLIEAVAQTSVGGLVGVVLGIGGVFVIPIVSTWMTGKPLPAQINVNSIFYALAVAICVGVGFGWYPARRAALLDPIEALRHE
jgi:putative ABC transport system permease protein